MKSIRTIVGIGLAGALVVALSPAAQAEERKCRGRIGGRTVDNLKVPAGAKCVLRGTTVKGTITIDRRGVLDAKNIRVTGNVQGENARMVEVYGGSIVGGSIQVVQGRAADVRNTRVKGDILYDEQRGRVRAKRVKIGGNLQAFQSSGGVRIVKNVIDGNLQCKASTPAPTGYGNRVDGSKEDQCRRL